jgi:hypothetical protein
MKGRFEIPVALCGFLMAVPSLVMFALVRLGVPRLVYAAIPFAIAFWDPILMYCHPLQAYGLFSFFKLFCFMRVADIALLEPALVRSWTWREFCEYYYTYHTHAMREELQKAGKKPGTPRAIPYEARDASYYGRWAWKMTWQYAVYHGLVWYLQTYPPNNNPSVNTLTNILDFKQLLDNLVFTLVLCVLLSLSYNLSFHLFCDLLKAPFEPIMNSPLLSTSLRDFWSNRWNYAVKVNLHRLGFKPTLKVLKVLSTGNLNQDSSTPTEEEQVHYKHPAWHYLLGGFGAFILSGLIHEWLVLVLMERTTTWESTIFFIIHGAIMTTEVLFSRAGKSLLGFDPIAAVPRTISIPITAIILLVTSPLFFNPWIREDYMVRLRIPLVTDLF